MSKNLGMVTKHRIFSLYIRSKSSPALIFALRLISAVFSGTANSTSSGDLSPILPVSEPSTPVKNPTNFLPPRSKTSSEQSLVSIVKPVMSVKAAAVVHPEVVTNVSLLFSFSSVYLGFDVDF